MSQVAQNFTIYFSSSERSSGGTADCDKNKNVTFWRILSYAGTQKKHHPLGAPTHQHPEFDINTAGTDVYVIS